MESFLQGQETFDTKGQKWLEIYFKKGGNPYFRKQRNSKIIGSVLKELPNSGFSDVSKLDIEKFFENPKPVALVDILLRYFTKKEQDAIILDFFSGSATAAHAAMQLNAEDGGKRKFICVQLPEVCDENSTGTKLEAFKAGYKNICEIGKERIRRAGAKIKSEDEKWNSVPLNRLDGSSVGDYTPAKMVEIIDSKDGKPPIEKVDMRKFPDVGFRVLKLDESNMKDVYYNAIEWANGKTNEGEQIDINDMDENIKPDRTPLDLLFACLLDWGLPLDMPFVSEKLDNYEVFTYNNDDLIACFDKAINEKLVRELAARKPLRVVFRDSSFESSPQKINLFEIFKLVSPNTSVKVI
jgi:adenine-specific DNA-methyltransferase